jgi:hypothetical protein
MRLTLSESGAPLSGRNANAAEIALLGNQRHAVAKVFPEVLGRNGRAYVSLRPAASGNSPKRAGNGPIFFSIDPAPANRREFPFGV